MVNRKIFLIVSIMILLGGVFLILSNRWIQISVRVSPPHLTPFKYWHRDPINFEECGEAGGKILLSYPAQCTFRDRFYSQSRILEDKASQIDTTNWKTYRSEEYKFEFQYPVNFKEYKTNEKEVRIANFDWEEGNYDWPSNAVLIYAYAGDPFQNYLYSPEGYEQEEKNFILDGEKAIISAVKDPEENNGNTVISVVTIKNGVYYAVEIIPWSESNEELFDKVLSTFRFIK